MLNPVPVVQSLWLSGGISDGTGLATTRMSWATQQPIPRGPQDRNAFPPDVELSTIRVEVSGKRKGYDRESFVR